MQDTLQLISKKDIDSPPNSNQKANLKQKFKLDIKNANEGSNSTKAENKAKK